MEKTMEESADLVSAQKIDESKRIFVHEISGKYSTLGELADQAPRTLLLLPCVDSR